MTISDSLAVTGPGFEEDENLTKNTTAQDDQEHETESLSELLQTRRQISRSHENMGHPSNRSLCSGIFVEKVESDGTRLEFTPLEAPWRSGKTERAGRDWKEDYYKMIQDGPEAPTWKDFEEDCDAVTQARASKNNDSGYSAYQRVLWQESSTDGRCRLGMWRSRPRRSEPAADRRSLALDQKRGTRTRHGTHERPGRTVTT